MLAKTANGRPLRVGLNLLFLGDRAGGVGRYAGELPEALLEAEPETQITVFVATDFPRHLRAKPWARNVRWFRFPLPTTSRRLQIGQYFALPLLAASRGLDVLHSPGNTGPVITPAVASVVSLMDLIWLHRPIEWEPDARAHAAMRRLAMHSLRHADRVFTISRAVEDDFVSTLGLPRERIVVTQLGVRRPTVRPATEFEVRERLALGRARVLLCVAQKRPYKNLERLVRALPALGPDVVLVIPGSSTAYEAELHRLAATLGVSERLRLPGWLSEAELEGLYGLSEAFVLPSLIEGFGLPVLEAMARDLPVSCSDIPALREVAGEAALLFNPNDQAAIDGSLRRLLIDPELRSELARRGQRRAAAFSWAQTGAASLSGYREAIASRS